VKRSSWIPICLFEEKRRLGDIEKKIFEYCLLFSYFEILVKKIKVFFFFFFFCIKKKKIKEKWNKNFNSIFFLSFDIWIFFWNRNKRVWWKDQKFNDQKYFNYQQESVCWIYFWWETGGKKLFSFWILPFFFCIFFFSFFWISCLWRGKENNQTRMKGGWKERCLALDSFPCFFVFSSKEAFWKFSRSSLPLLIFFLLLFFRISPSHLSPFLLFTTFYFLLFLSLLIFDYFLISIFDLIFFLSSHWLGFCRINQSFFWD